MKAANEKWERKATPHDEHMRAVDKLIDQQAVKAVRMQPAYGPTHQKAAVEIPKKVWDDIRGLSRSRGFPVAEDRLQLGPEEAARFAAALRTAAPQCPEHAREALGRVLSVLHLGRGLQVSGVQG